MHSAGGEHSVAEVDEVGLELGQFLLQVVAGDVQPLVAVPDLLAQLGEELPVLLVRAVGDDMNVPAAAAKPEELVDEEGLRDLREVVGDHDDSGRLRHPAQLTRQPPRPLPQLRLDVRIEPLK